MKPFTERSTRKMGIVVVAMALVATGLIVGFNRSIFQSHYVIAARFGTAAGIHAGTPVVLAGVHVGSVSSVKLDGNSVIASLDVDSGTVLPQHTDAAIQVQTLLGVLQVSLVPMRGWSHPLHSGALLTHTSIPVEFYQLQNAAGGLLSKSNASALNSLIVQLSKLSAGKQAEVAQIIAGLDKITTVVNARQSQVSQLIDAANTLAATVASRDSQLSSAISNMQVIMLGLSRESSTVRSLIANTEQVASETANLVGRNQPQLQSLLTHLHAVLSVVAAHQVDLAEAISYLDSSITGFASIGKAGNVNVPWANQFVDLAGSLGLNSVLGSCGLLSHAMRIVLGPDPLPCSARSGPLPEPASGSAVAPSGTAGGSGSSTGAGSAGNSTSGGAPDASSLAGLLPMLGGGS
ncbi:MAG: MCE family protein [Acidimicrobiales bacterium]